MDNVPDSISSAQIKRYRKLLKRTNPVFGIVTLLILGMIGIAGGFWPISVVSFAMLILVYRYKMQLVLFISASDAGIEVYNRDRIEFIPMHNILRFAFVSLWNQTDLKLLTKDGICYGIVGSPMDIDDLLDKHEVNRTWFHVCVF